MIIINENNIILEQSEINEQINYIEITNSPKFKYKKLNNNTVFFADLTKDYNSNCQILKNINKAINYGISFGIPYKNYNLIGIINNKNYQIENTLKAMFIEDLKEKYNFIFDIGYKEACELSNKYVKCEFKNDICINFRENTKLRNKNKKSCCSENFRQTKLTSRIINIHDCENLQDKKCTIQNIACKLYYCNYLKEKFNLTYTEKDIMIFNTLFNEKQLLILKHNFFLEKNIIIEKLLEKDSSPLFWYKLKSKYFLLYDNKKLF